MDIKEICINEYSTIKNALKRLDETGQKILLVQSSNILKGVITDGDIRRWILKNGNLKDSVSKIMNKNPITVKAGSEYLIRDIMSKMRIEAIPIVSESHEIVDIVFWNENFSEKMIKSDILSCPVVIMAGGKGSRLLPFTTVIPKPLIPIVEEPIVERIINRFRRFGCQEFYLSVNYKKEMIKAYFKDLDKEYNLNFVEENMPLGTGGALSLLKDKIAETFIVSNCDILINGDYSKMIKYHKDNNNKITLITSMKYIKIPYGIIDLNENGTINKIIEKPEYDQLVNTGMYILEPEVTKDVPDNTFYHITDLIKSYIKKGYKVGTYPVSSKSWLDMGELDKMEDMIRQLEMK